jgi:hypothetical protein
MAQVSAEPIDRGIEEQDDARLGGNVVVWVAVVLVGLGLFAAGLRLAPGTSGFLLMIAGGLVMGPGYAELLLRLPSMTHRFSVSLLLALVCSALLVGVPSRSAANEQPLTPNPDALLQPPGR